MRWLLPLSGPGYRPVRIYRRPDKRSAIGQQGIFLRRIVMSFMLHCQKLACMALERLPISGEPRGVNKQWGKALIVTDGQLVKLGLRWIACLAH